MKIREGVSLPPPPQPAAAMVASAIHVTSVLLIWSSGVRALSDACPGRAMGRQHRGYPCGSVPLERLSRLDDQDLPPELAGIDVRHPGHLPSSRSKHRDL